MPQSFGARLRQRREGEAIALATIAEQTKIKLSLLEALERDDVSQWPSGIFRRAFIRAYADAIGLNPDDVVREFLEVHPEPAEVLPAVEAIAAREDGRANSGPPTRLRYIMGSAFGSLARLRRPATADDAGISEPPQLQRPSDLVTTMVPDDVPPAAVATPPVSSAPPVAAPSVAARAASASRALTSAAVVPRVVAPAAAEPPEDVAPSEDGAAADDVTPFKHAAPEPSPVPRQVETRSAARADRTAVNEPPLFQPDLAAVARLCTELGRVDNADDLQRLLSDAAGILDATGLIVWLWDEIASELRPALAHGYSDRVLAQLPPVTPDADNATAAAFRSAQPCAINGSERAAGALAVPLLMPSGCGGVLAIELQHGREQVSAVRSVATILAAMLAQLAGGAPPAEAAPQVESVQPVHAGRYTR